MLRIPSYLSAHVEACHCKAFNDLVQALLRDAEAWPIVHTLLDRAKRSYPCWHPVKHFLLRPARPVTVVVCTNLFEFKDGILRR
jgi:hypothetical protein